ncbi:transglutaminase-like domain-containing protein [Adhaeribacter radiodurans]|uniref:Transglutaminase family protein n=1 Tax=Adhaeribacter radiodurans TaxID=2745197 RepID=A0A7L7L8C1_9BACT|nr:transglutaminase family protein [Adhaeribacter radiodurans]QMU28649.1 transglutaminase family protein [Adhaeribacter radiodurans]
MKFQVHSDLEYQVLQPSTFILNIHALRTATQTVLEESLMVEPYIRLEEFSSALNANRFIRLEVTEPLIFKISYKATVDTISQIIDQKQEKGATPVVQLDGDIIPNLFPSRYCQSDKLQRLANNKFGKIENTFAQVIAITDWIYENVEYLSGSTNSQTSAYDTVSERAGVCRDFAHLGIALCRALSIPARYFTAYAYNLNPPDFHACFEAYIGGHWLIFDATKLAPLNGLVKIANGRDAADAAVASIFGNVVCQSMQVTSEVLENNFEPFYYDNKQLKGLSYE